MNPSDAPNPERRSNSAMLCVCIGIGLCLLAYVLGIGAILGTAFGGGDPVLIAGGLVSMIAIGATGFVGFIMTIVGGVWMTIQVIADQRGGAEESRYRDVER